VIAVDTNILVYAHRTDAPFHEAAAQSLIEIAQGSAAWAIPWPCLHEFLAVVTNRRIYDSPSTLEVALDFVDSLLQSPTLLLLAETETHWPVLRSLVVAGQTTGGRIHDARIAALCSQHGVRELWSADRDFSRFPALRVLNPLLR
jgi:toxin-antitoxin system PIN domain toxin